MGFSQTSFLARPVEIELQTAKDHFVPQEASSYDIRLQTTLFEQPFLLEQLGQLAFQGNCVILYAQKELFPSLKENLAQLPEFRLDLLLL